MLARAEAMPGVARAGVLSRIMTGLPPQVTPTAPVTFLGVSSLLLATGLPAGWVPAVRGIRGGSHDPDATSAPVTIDGAGPY